MVNWGALIEAPIGVLLLYVAIVMIQPLQDPLFGLLGNSVAFPHGGATTLLIQLLPLILGVMLLYSAYKGFMEPQQPGFIQG